MNLAPDLARVAIFLVGAIWVILRRWQLGQLLAFQSYLCYVYGPALSLTAFSLQFQNALTALECVSTLFDILSEENPVHGLTVDHLSGEVEFKDVSFAYNGIDPVLERLSLHIAPGEQVAIVSPSRVSKTTLISLILRFYRPLQGEIFFDNHPASNYDFSSLLRRIGYVSQNPLLLAGTILDNLRYGDPQAPLEKVIEAAKAAGIHDFIANLPELTHGKIVFLVAHRLATVQHTDRILLLNEKRIVDFDTHAELLGHSVFYRTLVASQNLI